MKKVIFFTSTLNIGGIERVFLNYAGLLSDKGYDVTYLVCYDGGDFFHQIPHRVALCNLGTNKLRKSLFALARFLKEKNPDAIIVANSATIIVYIAKLISGSNVKIIASHHNYLNVDVSSVWDTKVIWKFYNRCDAVIAISKGIYTHLLEHGVLKKKIKLVYNPINVSEIEILSKEKTLLFTERYILFVGRLSKVKNIAMAIRAFKPFHQKFPSYSFFIVGDGPEETYLQNLVSEMGLSDVIRFIGCVPNPYPYISSASLIVLSSFSEAFPTILLESLSLGKTVVSTPTQGAKEILQTDYGYISKSFDDISEYTSLLEYGVDNPISSSILKKYVMKFDVENAVKEIEYLWNN